MKFYCFESIGTYEEVVQSLKYYFLESYMNYKLFSLKISVTVFQEFYNNADKHPRVFGMTASPIIGKGNGVLT
jgi:hypothetical protein